MQPPKPDKRRNNYREVREFLTNLVNRNLDHYNWTLEKGDMTVLEAMAVNGVDYKGQIGENFRKLQKKMR